MTHDHPTDSCQAHRTISILLAAMIVMVMAMAVLTINAWVRDRAKTRTQIAAIEILAKECPGFRPVAHAVLEDRRSLNPYGYRYASDIAGQMASMSPARSGCRTALPDIQ